MMLLDTKRMHERLVQSGFTDEQADGFVAVIRELAETFVTKDYLDARLGKLEAKLSAKINRMALLVVGTVAGLLAIFEFLS